MGVEKRSILSDRGLTQVERVVRRPTSPEARPHLEHLRLEQQSLMRDWMAGNRAVRVAARTGLGGKVEFYRPGKRVGNGSDSGPLDNIQRAQGHQVEEEKVLDLLGTFSHWVVLEPEFIGHTVKNTRRDNDTAQQVQNQGSLLESRVLPIYQEPFVTLVVADPVPQDALGDLHFAASEQLRIATSKKFSNESGFHLAEERHSEVDQALATRSGFWKQPRFLVGANSEQAVRELAATIAAAANTSPDHQYRLSFDPYAPTKVDLATLLQKPSDVTVSTDLVASLSELPQHSISGFTVEEQPFLGVNRDVSRFNDSDIVYAGKIIDNDGHTSGEFPFPLELFTRHTFIVAPTGTGKTVTVQNLLEGLSTKDVPWLVLDPGDSGYPASMASRLESSGKEVIRIKLGEVDAVHVGDNLLAPVEGFSLKEHAERVVLACESIFSAGEGGTDDAAARELMSRYVGFAVNPNPEMKVMGIRSVYEDFGWNMHTGEPTHPNTQPIYPTLLDVARKVSEIIEKKMLYSKDTKGDVQTFVVSRLLSMQSGIPGEFASGHPIDYMKLLNHNVVVETDGASPFTMATFLLKLDEATRLREKMNTGRPLDHVTVIEEAHMLFGGHSDTAKRLAGLVTQVRKRGEGLIFVDQSPEKVNSDVIRNCATKIVHTIADGKDRETIGTTMRLKEGPERDALGVLTQPGRAVVFADDMTLPVRVQMPDPRSKPAPNSSLISSAEVLVTPWPDSEVGTLRERYRAEEMLHDQLGSREKIWAEIAFTAYFLGEAIPQPAGQFAEDLRAMNPKVRDILIGMAVVDVIKARMKRLISAKEPIAPLIESLTSQMRAIVSGEQQVHVEDTQGREVSPEVTAEIMFVADENRTEVEKRLQLAADDQAKKGDAAVEAYIQSMKSFFGHNFRMSDSLSKTICAAYEWDAQEKRRLYAS